MNPTNNLPPRRRIGVPKCRYVLVQRDILGERMMGLLAYTCHRCGRCILLKQPR